MSAALCLRCQARTRTNSFNACVVCGTPRPVNELPDKTLEECGQQVIPLFPESQVVS